MGEAPPAVLAVTASSAYLRAASASKDNIRPLNSSTRPPKTSLSMSLRFPLGSAAMPNNNSASDTLDRYSVSADCSLSQALTAGSGSGFIASETTLVSKTIIQTSSARPVSCRVPAPRPQRLHWSIQPRGLRPRGRHPCEDVSLAERPLPEWRAPRPRRCDCAAWLLLSVRCALRQGCP